MIDLDEIALGAIHDVVEKISRADSTKLQLSVNKEQDVLDAMIQGSSDYANALLARYHRALSRELAKQGIEI